MDYQKSTPPAYGGHQQPTTGTPVSPTGHSHGGAPGPWSSGICDCFSDVPNCYMTFWCPCITFGQITEIVDRGTTSCGASGALYTLLQILTGCGCIYSCFYRKKMRKQYMLEDSPVAIVLFIVAASVALCAKNIESLNTVDLTWILDGKAMLISKIKEGRWRPQLLKGGCINKLDEVNLYC